MEKVSITYALLSATEHIRSDIDSNKFVSAAFIDLSKAIDSMYSEILIENFNCVNFGDKGISMIKTYLQARIQKVIHPPYFSNWTKLYQGVPQGTILCPLLYNFMRSSIQRPTQLVQ